jgi:hypothetical protein
MGWPMRSTSWLCLLLLLFLGCGGKIVETAAIPDQHPAEEEPRLEPPPSFGTPAAPGTQPSPPAPTSVTPLDACEVLCERDARCDTTLPALPVREGETGDCKTRCNERLAGKCGIDDWLLCYASKIEPGACTPLPDDCRPAFCAWAWCAKQPVSNCE